MAQSAVTASAPYRDEVTPKCATGRKESGKADYVPRLLQFSNPPQRAACIEAELFLTMRDRLRCALMQFWSRDHRDNVRPSHE
jgi:hypothetical protein